MTTEDNRVGPRSIPVDRALGHLRVISHGTAVELYVDLTAGGIYRYGDE
jgi:hypothetical protein